VPAVVSQQVLDTALARAPEPARAQFRELLAAGDRDRPRPRAGGPIPAARDAASLTEWLTATGTSDEAIGNLDGAVVALAEAHPRRAPALLLAEAGHLQGEVQRLLGGGRLRHRQERELLRVNGDLLAHMNLLLSDLDHNGEASDYGNAALMFLREAGAIEAPAWYVLTKIARWRRNYVHAADLAGRGEQHSPAGPMRVQLASYEANAAALAGDAVRARLAMRQAEQSAAALPGNRVAASPWSFPEERMTIFRLSVALRTGDLNGALRDAAAADATWSPDGPHVPAAWAQIRIGGAIACVLRGEPDGAAEHVRPVLAMPPELRIATVTGWLADLDHQLAAGRFARDPLAVGLRQEILDFTTNALPALPAKEELP